MNKQKKVTFVNKIIMTALIGVIALALAGCGTGTDSEGSEDDSNASGETKEEITVASVQDYPPFEFKVDEELTGFDVELVEAVAEKANLTVNWKNMKFDGIIPALQANQVDAAVSAIGIREDRLEVVNFSDPYFESGLSLITLKDSAIEGEEDLEGKTIVAKQGTSSLKLANELAEEYNAEVTKLQDDATMYMELENGNADVVINDYPSVAYKINQDGEDSQLQLVGDKYPSEDYGIAISKGSEGLVEKMNTGLQELKDSGEFDEIYSKYFSEE
ncbi:polar amino acid transport system substrate-binding protein [Gracilibacillus orientalis]|uniref:Polar amino acid transport system substrate-binding protein n=1 Tax=Gracilibacillus orientalis TaxID=334253 RepID=A0A1I4JZA1_9BACI|nr:transporter substrate-binding domain-containing protein [Gracilibacillus orientalis]SFL71889.1 polar amino acid transport system substrate-binding protein [Gracilibacillus orientalis]